MNLSNSIKKNKITTTQKNMNKTKQVTIANLKPN